MTPDLIVLEPNILRSRLLLIGVVLVMLVLTWFGVRWQLGDMLANLTLPTDENAPEIAVFAENLAPSDPRTSWLRAETGDQLPDDSSVSSVERAEQTVRLAPFDYRWRVDLGRALERDDQLGRAEAELKRAVELATSFAYPRWHLGNFYLRQNRTDEAFAQLKEATKNNTEYREQVYSLAWEYFARDAAQVEKMAGNDPDARASLAYFFAAHGRAADSLRNWNLLSDRDKAANYSIAKSIALGLYEQRHFVQALEFSKQTGNDVAAFAGAVTNGGFESPLTETETAWFGWQITRSDPKIEAVADGKQKHLGDRSLRVTFRNYVKPVLANIFQTVVVEPKTRYRLRFFVRTDGLKSSGGPMIEIGNANDDKSIAQSKQFQMGNNDWQEMTVEFTAPDNCDGIQIRTIRAYCGDSCAINGTFWYDDFELTKL